LPKFRLGSVGIFLKLWHLCLRARRHFKRGRAIVLQSAPESAIGGMPAARK
jgi:hypothetical protein